MALDKFLIFLSLIITVFGISIKPKQSEECCEEYCYDTDNVREQYDHFAGKRPYNFVKGTDPEIYRVSGELLLWEFYELCILKFEMIIGCEAEKIWILHRHGTRLPNTARMVFAKQLENVSLRVFVNRSAETTQYLYMGLYIHWVKIRIYTPH